MADSNVYVATAANQEKYDKVVLLKMIQDVEAKLECLKKIYELNFGGAAAQTMKATFLPTIFDFGLHHDALLSESALPSIDNAIAESCLIPVAPVPAPFVAPFVEHFVAPFVAPSKTSIPQPDLSRIHETPSAKQWRDDIYNFLKQKGTCMKFSDIGNVCRRPHESHPLLKLAPLLQEDTRFQFRSFGHRDAMMIGLASWGFSDSQATQAVAEVEDPVLGLVYLTGERHVYISFDAEKYPLLFNRQQNWLDDQHAKGEKLKVKNSKLDKKTGKKYGLNLIAFENNSPGSDFSLLPIGTYVKFRVRTAGLANFAIDVFKA